MGPDNSPPCARLGVLADQVIGNAVRKTEPATYESQSLRSRVSRGCKGYEETLHRNWGGNVWFGGAPVVPASLGELQQVVQNSKTPIRVVGRGHSFTPVAECTGGTLLSLAQLNHVLEFEPPTSDRIGSITVEGGTTYTEIAQFLGRRGALRNLPSCPQFTVAGAIATGTHGSGVHIQNLAADIAMIEFVKADGSLVSYSRYDRPELLEGCRVHMGCLGVVSRLTLDVVPFYEVETRCYIDASLDSVIDNLPVLWQSCDSLSFWTSGFGHGPGAGTGWLTFRHFAPHWNPSLAAPAHNREELLGGATLLETATNRYCTDVDKPVKFHPTGRGPWHDRLSLTLDEAHETSMTVVDIQAEFFVPLQHAQAAIRAVWDTSKKWTFSAPWGHTGEPIKGLVDAMEFRQVKGDNAWLSPQSVDSLGIHVSFNGDPARRKEVLQVLPSLELALKPFRARAHWGKLSTLTCAPSRIEELFGKRLQQFRALCKEHDLNGKFRNSYIQKILFSNEID
eukprot:TRINITY_DN75833_c0_g1_i1.p1 TRINITY_DN75833_c0_g1~~TRINITY_DN75833_c0_g1_i1.p1  ORF type:complete len:508 (+),score=63.94 TRINITY_DN75833_c0_g1_i1:61-1584(+)